MAIKNNGLAKYEPLEKTQRWNDKPPQLQSLTLSTSGGWAIPIVRGKEVANKPRPIRKEKTNQSQLEQLVWVVKRLLT